MEFLHEKQTWELVNLLEGQLAIENKWVYEKRKGTSGAGKVEFQVPGKAHVCISQGLGFGSGVF